MLKKYLSLVFLLIGISTVLSGCSAGNAGESRNADAATAAGAGTDSSAGPAARVEGKQFLLRGADGSYQAVFLNGVNIGSAKPGTFPGELAVTKDEYLRWFGEIAAMNVNVIRVYTIQMPDFYDALAEYNKKADRKLYLMQGIYLNEDVIAKYNDALSKESGLQDTFESDIRTAADILHGNADVEKKNNYAGGTYKSDVSDYTIGWILGIEWGADFVSNTNNAHPDETSFTGKYVYTSDASPFEVFLAQAAETAVSYEMEKYNTGRPVAFCNWATTDPLSHPNEPNPQVEDVVSVDAEHIKATDEFKAGFFASYHVYPYYPDSFSYDRKYLQENPADPYLAYLKELNAYHSMPVFVAEYGIPSSRGIAHKNAASGLSQGYATEQQQAEWLISMNKDIKAAGCMGGLIFSWQDEWFKKTWNTMDYEDNDRRPYWHNLESPEECFGLLAFAAGAKKDVITLDGKADEWSAKDLVSENGDLKLSVKYDTDNVYLLVQSDTLNLDTDTILIPIDTIGDQGNTEDRSSGCTFERGADFLLRIHGKEDTELMNDLYYDVFQFDYGRQLKMVPFIQNQDQKDSGIFSSINLVLSRKMHLPETNQDIPFQKFNTGKLLYGNGDPESADYSSLADFASDGDTLEIRIPWELLNVTDPSSREILADFNSSGEISSQPAEDFYFGICRDANAGTPVLMNAWNWDAWDAPVTHERLKQSYYLLQSYFADEQK